MVIFNLPIYINSLIYIIFIFLIFLLYIIQISKRFMSLKEYFLDHSNNMII
jgi:hypothetical protein